MNMRNLMIGLFCVLAINVFAAETSSLVIPETQTPPKLDGTLDDPVWQKAAKIEQLYSLSIDKPNRDTTVYLARDKKWLYLGFKCINPNMGHVIQTVFKHDDHYPTFYANDSVEVYLKPEKTKNRYYWFVLSFANVTFEKFIDKPRSALSWKAPWRSVTKRLPDGWTAEVAIPLYALQCDDLSGMEINIARNTRVIDLDQYGAKQNEKTVLSTLKASSRPATHDFKNFVAVSGFGESKPEKPFTPTIAAAEATDWGRKNGKYFYDVKISLMRFTRVAGKVKVQVIEDLGAGDVEKLSVPVNMGGKPQKNVVLDGRFWKLVLSVPVEDLRERKVKVALVDPGNGAVLAVKNVDVSGLRVIKRAFVGRSYYTSEKNADIRLELGLPGAMLKEAVLSIDVNDRKKVSETRGLKPVMTAKVPLSALKIGNNTLIVRLVSEGKELVTKKLSVKRLAPRPGFEVKTDLIKGVLLKDDKAIFPVGIVTYPLGIKVETKMSSDGEEGMFKLLSDVGFNTLVVQDAYTDTNMLMELADKYGMNVISWSYKRGTRRLGCRMQNLIPPRSKNLPLKERLKIQRAIYEKGQPLRIAETKILRDHKNFIGYWNFDEPNLGNRYERIAIAEWYWNTINKIDPYHPLFLLYSMNVPHGKIWTDWGQLVGFDIYPRPFTGRIYSEPGLYSAYYAYVLRERCRQDNKVMFFTPLAGGLPDSRSPIGMSKAHTLCQAYTSVIYGARGLLYFSLYCVHGEHAWDALRTVCSQIKEMTPALVNGDIAQNISYSPDNFKPMEQKFPMVNAAVYKYPNGDYLLMAANIMPYAVDTKFKIGGIKSGKRLFDENESSDDKVKLKGESFTDKIEGYGVRAYRIKLESNPNPVQVALNMTALKDEKAPSVDFWGIVNQVKLGKNHIPNPCFKQQFNKGIPDFFCPRNCDRDIGKKGSAWYVDNEMLWNGNPSLRIFHDKSDKRWFGTSTICTWYMPKSDKPVKMTFSFYAKCDKPGGRISFKLGNIFSSLGKVTTFGPLTTEWKRYSVTGDSKLNAFFRVGEGRGVIFWPSPGATIWISGLQLEAGETATEFQDSSEIDKK